MASGEKSKLTRLIGPPKNFVMEHRLFNALSLVGGFFSIAGGILNLSVNPESPLRYLPLVTGSLFFVFYYVARFRRYFQGLLWPSILMIMGTLCSVWFLYGGLNGYIQYYYFPGVVTSIVLVRGSKKQNNCNHSLLSGHPGDCWVWSITGSLLSRIQTTLIVSC